jgi:mono/diheme cytochrome c family protein
MNGVKSQRLLGVTGLLVLLTAHGCLDRMPGKPNPASRPKLPSEQTDFEVLFARSCSGCHGADGKLGPAPPLNDPLFLAIVPDDALLEVITHGRAGTPMPAFDQRRSGTLTDEQIKIVAAGLKTNFKAAKPDAELPPYKGELTAPPSAEQIARGEKLFGSACATCHGKAGRGSGDNETAPGSVNDPALLAVISDQTLRRIIITGRPDLGMPNYAESDGRDSTFKPLTSQEIDDLVALLSHWREQRQQVALRTAPRER